MQNWLSAERWHGQRTKKRTRLAGLGRGVRWWGLSRAGPFGLAGGLSVGTMAAMVEAQGEVIGRQDYSAYGSAVAQSGLMPSVGYAGMWQHHDSGINLTWYRGYQPAAGRWLSRDPIEEDGGLNLFGYVKGNPLSGIDLTGLRVINCLEQVYGLPRKTTMINAVNEQVGSKYRPGLIFSSPGVQPDVGGDPRFPRRPPVKIGFDKYIVVDKFSVWKESVFVDTEVHQSFAILCRYTVSGVCNTEKIATETNFKDRLMSRDRVMLSERSYEVFERCFFKFLWPL